MRSEARLRSRFGPIFRVEGRQRALPPGRGWADGSRKRERLETMRTILQAAAGFAAAAILSAASTAPAQAQQAPQNGWYKVCAKQEETDICNVQFQSVASNGQLVTAVSLATVKGKVNRRVFQVTVPTGRLIPAGVKVKIDDKKENAMAYFICIPQSCMAEATLDDNLITILKSGKQMVVTSTNFQNKANPVTITLEGFTSAFDGEPLKQDELQARQQQLQEELRRKAEEQRKKLQAEQDKAKAATQSN